MNYAMQRRRRWSDNDRRFGPFTYARDTHGWPLSIVLDSGDEEHPGCHLRVRGFGHTVLIELPPVIRPWRQKIVAGWDAATIARLGRDWYWDEHGREYGFTYSPDTGFLQVFLGRQTHDSSTEQSWCKHLPWTQWRHVRFSLHGLHGEHFWTMREADWTDITGVGRFEAQRRNQELCPSASFEFADFDGELIEATTHIEEREWRFGESWFKWLSVFRKPKIRRSLDIRFSKGTGRRKGSWKGGCIGTGIDLMPGELHEAAFLRYCDRNEMTFVGAVRVAAEA